MTRERWCATVAVAHEIVCSERTGEVDPTAANTQIATANHPFPKSLQWAGPCRKGSSARMSHAGKESPTVMNQLETPAGRLSSGRSPQRKRRTRDRWAENSDPSYLEVAL